MIFDLIAYTLLAFFLFLFLGLFILDSHPVHSPVLCQFGCILTSFPAAECRMLIVIRQDVPGSVLILRLVTTTHAELAPYPNAKMMEEDRKIIMVRNVLRITHQTPLDLLDSQAPDCSLHFHSIRHGREIDAHVNLDQI